MFLKTLQSKLATSNSPFKVARDPKTYIYEVLDTRDGKVVYCKNITECVIVVKEFLKHLAPVVAEETVTEKETLALDGIADSDYFDGPVRPNHYVWSWSGNPFGKDQ